MTTTDALRALAEYTRSLEEELDGPDAGEGEALVNANALLADEQELALTVEAVRFEIVGRGFLSEDDWNDLFGDWKGPEPEDPEWGSCASNDGKPHRASLSLCVYCNEYDPE